MERNTIVCADALSYLKTLPDESVNCCISSPPYMGLRRYLSDDDPNKALEIGTEPTFEAYIGNLVTIFRELRRVLRSDGTFWLNCGDSFWGSGQGYGDTKTTNKGHAGSRQRNKPEWGNDTIFKPKDLMLVPARLAIALQEDGWTVRQDVIWHKPNTMPSSQRDRPTTDYEHVFMLTRSRKYWYDDVAVAEPSSGVSGGGWSQNTAGAQVNHGGDHSERPPETGFRTLRAVWSINTEPLSLAHYATFPQKLVETCIKASCPETCRAVCGAPYVREVERESFDKEGWGKAIKDHTGNLQGSQSMIRNGNGRAGSVFVTTLGFAPSCDCGGATAHGVVIDPFSGAGTVALVARKLGRDYIGCDLNPEYVTLAKERLRLPFEPHYVEPEATDLGSLPFFADEDNS